MTREPPGWFHSQRLIFARNETFTAAVTGKDVEVFKAGVCSRLNGHPPHATPFGDSGGKQAARDITPGPS
jgi:hypothetical protein